MPQCPSCKSYSSGEAAFCSQCGAWLGNAARPRRVRRGSGRLPFYVASVLIAALGGVLAVLALSDTRRQKLSGRPVRPQDGAALLRAGVEEGGETPRVTAARLPAPEPENPLQHAEATRLALGALVVLDLRRQDDRPLRETRGVLVEPDGVVLCRLSPLLGAYGGNCRFLRSDSARIPIIGLSYSSEPLDLALIRIERVPDGTPALPILPDSPARIFAAGDTIFAVNVSRAQEAAVASPHAMLADRVARMILDEEPPVSPEAFLALDVYGAVVGLVRPEVNGVLLGEDKPRPPGGARMVVDPAHSFALAVDRPATMSLAELTSRLYEGTFADLYTRGTLAQRAQRWKEGIDLLEQALSRVAMEQPDAEDVTLATAALRECYAEELQRLLGSQRALEALPLGQAALLRFGAEAVILILTAEAQLALRDWPGAIVTLSQARAIDPGKRVDRMLEQAYLELAAEGGRAGDVRAQETYLLQGTQALSASAALHFEVGKLYLRVEALADAVPYLQRAAELDPSLHDTVEALLGKIDDALKRRESLVVPIPPGSKSIRCTATIDGTTVLPFLIDTGASFTTIPVETAAAMGYPTTVDARSAVTLQTANGMVVAPKITIQSLDLGGYSVRNLEVVLLPRSILGADSRGLIGLNFLNHFKYTIDASRREFRLERP